MSETCLFLALPRELRDEIYKLCLHYPDLGSMLDKHLEETRKALSKRFKMEVPVDAIEKMLEWTSLEVPRRPPLRCAGLLLANRQISSEAQIILHTKVLRIDTPISSNFSRDVRGLQITDFIGDQALARVRYAQLILQFNDLTEANNWYRTVNQLSNIWTRRNSLKLLKVHIQPSRGLERDHERAVTRRLVLVKLMDLSRVVPTEFEGEMLKRRTEVQ
ncbi:hypothetical protein, variant [Verruconis gallopava]|uniref:F-box domain-containing protein n=1 Tax=Verruconis gallopava TaxID=253628 RepID=A0A0D2A4N5_9PEZI|nr:hypothetical protein, variant [Verruconis gallopava]KIW01425.1 hypothetical protein, variant [Verruconis gallopava]